MINLIAYMSGFFVFIYFVIISTEPNSNLIKVKVKNNCTETVYYFFDGFKYMKADSQQFRIIFTGEVVNAYFTVGDKEYSTLNYYKQNQDCTK